MSLVDHLEELRQRVLLSLIAILISSAASLILVKPIVQILETPAKTIHFLQLSPGEFLFASIKVAGYCGITFALPFILYQGLRFILPGLTNKEKRFIAPAVAGSAILFFLGLSFALWVLIPAALKFLVIYGAEVVEPIWSIERYLDFVFLLMLSTGLAFQLPVLQLILGAFGLIQSKKMLSNWRLVVISAAIASAVLTPSTDPITMLLLATAIVGLFLIGVLMVAITEQFKPKTLSTDHLP
tara:strand:- start:449 stop:1171 length:723 start_codon:yes stop_codon:yes gene_type:complete